MKSHLTIISDRPYELGAQHQPYMVLSNGGTGPFSCAGCKYHFVKAGAHRCDRAEFVKFTGGSVLLDNDGNPLDDPSRACSDWFEPK